jgi:hypothetical protein
MFEETSLSAVGNLTKIPRHEQENAQVNGHGLILDKLAVHKKH